VVESLTKRRLTEADIRGYIARGLGQAAVTAAEEFTDGWFNSAFGVTLAEGRRVVLKVAPAPGVPLLRYEFELMRTEAEFYRRAAAAGVPRLILVTEGATRGYDEGTARSCSPSRAPTSPACSTYCIEMCTWFVWLEAGSQQPEYDRQPSPGIHICLYQMT
jgi:hypothetical protein